jgi:acyl carrier protein
MERQDIIEKLTVIFRDVFIDQTLVLHNEMSSADIKRWDSLTHMIIITKVEKLFNLKFKIKELTNMNNVGDMLDIIQSRM